MNQERPKQIRAMAYLLRNKKATDGEPGNIEEMNEGLGEVFDLFCKRVKSVSRVQEDFELKR